MKKIFFTFLVLILGTNYSFAEECLIQDKSAPALLEYTKNNQAIIKNITNSISKTNVEQSSLDKIKSTSIIFFNSAFSLSSYHSSFTYYAIYPISNEVPPEIRRDYNLLQKEQNGINDYAKSVINSGKGDLIVEDPCSGVSNCEIEKQQKAIDILQILLKNSEKILDTYRKIVINETIGENPEFVLTPTNFYQEMVTYYSPQAYGNCSKKEGGFFDTVTTKIKDITNWQNLSKDGIQKWKDAWAMLIGKDVSKEKQEETEKKLLMKELSNQGIHGDNQQNMISALDKFNQGNNSYFENIPNYVENTFSNTWNKLSNELKDIYDDNFRDYVEDKGTVPITTVETTIKNSVNTQVIKEQIHKTYLELSVLEAPSEANVTSLISRIIKSHIDIADSIDILTQTCEKAVKVCKQQDPSRGDCGKCN